MYWLNALRLEDLMRREHYSEHNRKAWMQQRMAEDRAELRRERERVRAGESHTEHEEPVNRVDNAMAEVGHDAPLPGPLTFSVWTHNGRRCVAVCMSSERAQWWLERYPGATVDITPRKGL